MNKTEGSVLEERHANASVEKGALEGISDSKVVALSIRQPWVNLILNRKKTIEVRSWSTRHRGTLWLHAAKHVDERLCDSFGFQSRALTRGALVGRVELYGCMEFTAASWEELRSEHLNPGPYEPGRFGWKLRDVVCVEPIPLSGKLGLMKLTASITEAPNLNAKQRQMKAGGNATKVQG